jgi:hypothetical protein
LVVVGVAGIGGAYGSAAEKANPSKAKRSNSKKLSPANKAAAKTLGKEGGPEVAQPHENMRGLIKNPKTSENEEDADGFVPDMT